MGSNRGKGDKRPIGPLCFWAKQCGSNPGHGQLGGELGLVIGLGIGLRQRQAGVSDWVSADGLVFG